MNDLKNFEGKTVKSIKINEMDEIVEINFTDNTQIKIELFGQWCDYNWLEINGKIIGNKPQNYEGD